MEYETKQWCLYLVSLYPPGRTTEAIKLFKGE